MELRALMDELPLWVTFLATAVLFIACWYLGYVLGRHRKDAGEDSGEVVGAALGLLAFVLALTFSMAESRYDARRATMLDEAIVLRNAYLRVGVVSAPRRDAVRNLLKEYLDVRLEGVRTGDIALIERRSKPLHDALWKEAVAMSTEDRSDATVMAIEGVNDVIDLHVRREALLYARVPGIIWLALYGLCILGMLLVGHHEGVKQDRQRFGVLVLAVAFALLMILVDDLDRPTRGLLTVSQQPMAELRAWMDSTRAP
jgi:hypothetical protein